MLCFVLTEDAKRFRIIPPQFGRVRIDLNHPAGSDTIGRKRAGSSLVRPGAEAIMNFEDAGKLIDNELKKFVEYVEQKVRPKTRQEMAQLLRKASRNLTKAAQSLEKK